MLREPKQTQQRKPVQVRKERRTGRFQIEKLEERIAPQHGRGCLNGGKENSGRC